MSIFGKIKTAIFGEHGPLGGQFGGRPATPRRRTAGAGRRPHADSPQALAAAPTAAPAAPASAPTPAAPPVDVDAVLAASPRRRAIRDLNWRDLDRRSDEAARISIRASHNRKELATELGYTGAKDGSAEMNIWLRKAVMRQLRDATKRLMGAMAQDKRPIRRGGGRRC